MLLYSYVNMDYLFLSSAQQATPRCLVVSYDIACQWSRNLATRCTAYGPEAAFIVAEHQIRYLVPKFHLLAHIQHCQANYSFNFTPLVGRTDGEAPERGWSAINAIAGSTKQMGPGSWLDTLDDHFGDYNWRKVASIGVSLDISTISILSNSIKAAFFVQKAIEAIKEGEIHVTEFGEFSAAPPMSDVQRWEGIVTQWELDPTKPNPFEVAQSSK